jgi:hypothetical protein
VRRAPAGWLATPTEKRCASRMMPCPDYPIGFLPNVPVY